MDRNRSGFTHEKSLCSTAAEIQPTIARPNTAFGITIPDHRLPNQIAEGNVLTKGKIE